MEILRGLGASDRTVSDVLKGLEVVRTLLENIAGAPSDARFRRVRKTNARIEPLMGLQEEGLLRAAGFKDAEDDTLLCAQSCPDSETVSTDNGCSSEGPTLPSSQLLEVLGGVQAVCAALRYNLEEVARRPTLSELGAFGCSDLGRTSLDLRCDHKLVSEAVECALLDFVKQKSADQVELDKRRRRDSDIEAVRSPVLWRAALDEAGGSFLLDGGPLESWLASEPTHRCMAHDLLLLQAAATRWYGNGARLYCEKWRTELLRCCTALSAETCASSTFKLFDDELQALRGAMFEFPERPGAAPCLFRESLKETTDDMGDCLAVSMSLQPPSNRSSVAVELE